MHDEAVTDHVPVNDAHLEQLAAKDENPERKMDAKVERCCRRDAEHGDGRGGRHADRRAGADVPDL